MLDKAELETKIETFLRRKSYIYPELELRPAQEKGVFHKSVGGKKYKTRFNITPLS